MAQPRHKQTAPLATTPEEKARILMELLEGQRGDKTVQPLLDKARQNMATEAPVSKDVLRKSAQELLKRVGTAKKNRPRSTTGPMQDPVLRTTVAGLLQGSRLSSEHPEIIALVLENQPTTTQASVLRGFDGPLARRVHKALTRRKKG